MLARSRREALKPLYLFNRNNPIFYVDPTGLTCIASISVMFYNSSVVSDATVNGQTDLSSGRQFSGALRAYDKDGQDVLGASVVSGGNRDPHSSVDQGDDTPIPSGSFSVGTAIPSGKIGFPVSGTAPRSGIEIHYNGVTTGCIAMVDNWDLFVQSMKETNEQCCKKSIPLSVWYNMSDGTSLPHGNSGHGHGDTGGRPGLWPEIEP